MKTYHKWFLSLLAVCIVTSIGWRSKPPEIVRPEQIKSKRNVIYSQETYQELAQLWQEYYQVFPSEDAYGNWMYASRYAGLEKYESLLKKGLKKYPANPTLLYLTSMLQHGKTKNDFGLSYLEKAAALDPSYMDPWFSLVIHYLERRDEDKLNFALRKILHGGIISEEVMDFSYNILLSLEKNAILITNGDNDTYPGWIMTRLLNIRPDVLIVNRSLLNTEWYPTTLIEDGAPNFISREQLSALRKHINKKLGASGTGVSLRAGAYGDTLIIRIIEESIRIQRPVYFASTLSTTDDLKPFEEQGLKLGLVTLVTPPPKSSQELLNNLVHIWLHEYRTGGLDSWRLAHSDEADGGRILTRNYAIGMCLIKDSLDVQAPECRTDLLNWYKGHVEFLLKPDIKALINEYWKDVPGVIEPLNRCPIHGTH